MLRGRRIRGANGGVGTALTVLALMVGLAGAFAIGGKGPPSSPFNAASSNGSAAKTQYCHDKDDKHGCKPKPCHKKHGCKPKPCHKKHGCKPKPKPGHHHH